MDVHRENVTIGEAIQRFGIARTKLYELIRKGDVIAVKLGRRTLVDTASLRQLFASLPRVGVEP